MTRRARILLLCAVASGVGVACAGAAEPAVRAQPRTHASGVASPPTESTSESVATDQPDTGSPMTGEPVTGSPPTGSPSSGSPTGEPSPAPRGVTIGASGDLLFHLKVIRSAREHVDDGGARHVLAGLREVITEDEIAFANLETPLSTRIDPETGDPPVMGAPAEFAEAVAAAGLDAVSVANNHSYDQMAAGLDDTLRALGGVGVGAVGASAEEGSTAGPLVIARDGVRVAFVAFTERVNRGPATRGPHVLVARYEDALAQRVLERAREVADVVVLSIHWSHDFVDSPRIAQRQRARRLVDAGADLIVGHGPHVLQTVERFETPRGDAVVAYSLGNLVSNQGMRYWAGRRIPSNMHPAVVIPEVRDGAWLRTRFTLDEGRLSVRTLEAVPLWTRNNFLDVALHRADRLDIGVGPLRAASPELQAERRPRIAEALGDAVTLLP